MPYEIVLQEPARPLMPPAKVLAVPKGSSASVEKVMTGMTRAPLIVCLAESVDQEAEPESNSACAASAKRHAMQFRTARITSGGLDCLTVRTIAAYGF